MVLKPILPKTLLLLPLLLYACAAPQSPPPARTPPPSQTHGGASYPSPVVTSPHGQPASIALLLPLSGTFSATAESVRDGFFSAYFAAISHPAARVYDVGSTSASLRAAYQTALSEGATFIVDRTSVGVGKSVSVRVDLGGR